MPAQGCGPQPRGLWSPPTLLSPLLELQKWQRCREPSSSATAQSVRASPPAGGREEETEAQEGDVTCSSSHGSSTLRTRTTIWVFGVLFF